MASYATTKQTLDQIADDIARAQRQVDLARDNLSTAAVNLAAMPSQYSAFVAQLNADAAANPGNEAWQTALAEKNELVGDFQALRTRAEALLAAYDAT